MPIFYQQDIDDSTKLAIWKIEEEESFFSRLVPLQREITHPHKRLQHLAGRYLLKYLFPDFPTELIRIADTRKPFLEDEAYHFSISHCGDYAAVIASGRDRVGIDLEIVSEKVARIQHKFLSEEERQIVNRESLIVNGELENLLDGTDNYQLPITNYQLLTLFWSAKESMFKWWGKGQVDFSEMLRLSVASQKDHRTMHGNFIHGSLSVSFPVHYRIFPHMVLAWVQTAPDIF